MSFNEPSLRFLDVLWFGLIGGLSLVFLGAPGGVLFEAISSLWGAQEIDDAASLAGSLAQVTLTVWTLVVSIGGATYIEASRTIRTDSRNRARALGAGREALRVAPPAGFAPDTPLDLLGQLTEIALDTPRLHPQSLRSNEALEALALDFDAVQDYWNRRSGYVADLNRDWTAPEIALATRQRKRVLIWRFCAVAAAAAVAACYAFFGWANVVSPVLEVLVLVCVYRARLQFLGRAWAS